MTIIQTAPAELMWNLEGAEAWREMCREATDGRWDCIHAPDEECVVARLALEEAAS